jgi:DNA polymerase III sliding clamp (beta) subunit (PCNA family)
VPKRATLPVLENLRWRAAKGHLELTATDLDNRLHISIPFVGEAIDSDVDALVPAMELSQLVKTESAPKLKIRIRNGKCEGSANKRTVVLSCADPNSFPQTPDGELKLEGQILGSAFDAALRRALFFVSTESGRYSTDVLKLELHGSVFRVVGTDGHRLSVVEGAAKTETNGNSACSVLLLRSTAAILSRLGLSDEPRWVQFSTCGSEQEFNLFVLPDGTRFITRRGQGQFPNYENVLPKAPLEARVVFRREELLEGLAKLSPTARKAQVPAVKLELSQSPVSIKTEIDGTASSVALEHTRVSGKARDIGFNHDYLTQYVKTLETDTVSMKLFSPAISEVVVFDAFRYQRLLMPLRF